MNVTISLLIILKQEKKENKVTIHVIYYDMNVFVTFCKMVLFAPLEEKKGLVPENEYEKHQQHAECGNIVHGFHQHHKLPPQGREESDQLQNS